MCMCVVFLCSSVFFVYTICFPPLVLFLSVIGCTTIVETITVGEKIDKVHQDKNSKKQINKTREACPPICASDTLIKEVRVLNN